MGQRGDSLAYQPEARKGGTLSQAVASAPLHVEVGAPRRFVQFEFLGFFIARAPKIEAAVKVERALEGVTLRLVLCGHARSLRRASIPFRTANRLSIHPDKSTMPLFHYVIK